MKVIAVFISCLAAFPVSAGDLQLLSSAAFHLELTLPTQNEVPILSGKDGDPILKYPLLPLGPIRIDYGIPGIPLPKSSRGFHEIFNIDAPGPGYRKLQTKSSEHGLAS